MTEAADPRRRLSRRALRAWAWVAGLATFASPAAALAVQPKAEVPETARERPCRQIVIHRTVVRRVIVREPAAPSGVRYVYAGGSSGSIASGSSSGWVGSGGSTSSGSGGSAPAPAPATTTGGS
jgi:uncharacterized membrane protein YgcG